MASFGKRSIMVRMVVKPLDGGSPVTKSTHVRPWAFGYGEGLKETGSRSVRWLIPRTNCAGHNKFFYIHVDRGPPESTISKGNSSTNAWVA